MGYSSPDPTSPSIPSPIIGPPPNPVLYVQPAVFKSADTRKRLVRIGHSIVIFSQVIEFPFR